MKDRYNREISYMRISLTDRCNFRCIYCMPEAGVEKCSHFNIISLEEIVDIVKAATKFGIKKIRLTGGEPLVRKGLVKFCQDLNAIEEIEEICITTNGSLLKPIAGDLKEAGVSRINFSLDTLDSEKYSYITRGGNLQDTLEAIEEAIKLGFKVKINTVLIGGFNQEDIKALVELTKENPIQVRFIELMKMGENANWEDEKFISNKIVLEEIPNLVEIESKGVAKSYKLEGYQGSIGLISPISSCFCQDCNRIRLTADGKLKPCLHSKTEVDLRGLKGKDLERAIEKAIFEKPKSHHLLDGKSEAIRDMNAIGG